MAIPMNGSRILNWAALVFAGALLLAGCTSGGGHDKNSKDGSSDGKSVSFSYDMPYQLDQVGAGEGALTKAFTASDVFIGTLTATNTDTSDVQTFDWSVYLDESTLAVQSNKTIVLDPGTYDFALLVHKGDHSYAGEALGVSIADGTDTVPLTLRPVIGDVTTNVNIVSRLIDLRFSYDPAEFSGAGISTPRIGISVDGGAEQLFAVNAATGFSEYMYLNLSPGSHHFVLRLFDGSVQRGKSLAAQEHPTLSPGVDVTMDLVALHGETTFSLTEEGGDAHFHFVIPAEVVNEAGGTGDLDARLHLVSAESGQDIEELLTLSPSGGDYTADVTHTGFQFEDVTVSLAFVDHTDAYPLGSCLQHVTLRTGPQSAFCNVTLVRRAVIGGSLLVALGVNVFSTDMEPVVGATVYLDGNPVGVTGSGGFGSQGYLHVLVLAGSHTLRAQTSTHWGQTTISVSALGLANPDIILDMLMIEPLGVSSIPFNPEVGPFANLASPVSGCDDCTTGLVIPIGFNFSFFGNVYSVVNISSNGFIGFDAGMYHGCCGGYHIPSSDGTNNLIAAAWTDLYPVAAGDIFYETRGVSPNRRFIVYYDTVVEYRNSGRYVVTQIVLHEVDSSIEIHSARLDSLLSHVYTQGVENASGTVGLTLPGRNALNFSLTNDGVRFGTN
jgi:hypothetical protein